VERIGFKPYPACHLNYSLADAAVALRADGIPADRIARIIAPIHPAQAEVGCEPQDQKRRPASASRPNSPFPIPPPKPICAARFTLNELDRTTFTEPKALESVAKVDWAEDPNT